MVREKHLHVKKDKYREGMKGQNKRSIGLNTRGSATKAQVHVGE